MANFYVKDNEGQRHTVSQSVAIEYNMSGCLSRDFINGVDTNTTRALACKGVFNEVAAKSSHQPASEAQIQASRDRSNEMHSKLVKSGADDIGRGLGDVVQKWIGERITGRAAEFTAQEMQTIGQAKQLFDGISQSYKDAGLSDKQAMAATKKYLTEEMGVHSGSIGGAKQLHSAFMRYEHGQLPDVAMNSSGPTLVAPSS